MHTMYITYGLKKNVYDEIFQSIKQICGTSPFPNEKDERENKGYTTFFLKDEGLSEIVLRHYNIWKKVRINKYQIEIRLNPIRLKEKEDHIKILKESDLPDALEKFTSIIQKIHPNLPSFDKWKMNRIDYAVNLKTPYVNNYIELFQRADKPRHFTEQRLQNRRTGQKRGSFYLHTKHITINFYDKEKQVKAKMPDDVKTIQQAQDVLRIEIQFRKGKTSEMKNEKAFLNKEVSNYLKPEHSHEVIMSYFKRTIGEGDYYTLAEARGLINNNHQLTSYTKMKLIDTLTLVNEKKSIWKAREEYKNTTLFNAHLKAIREIGINPVTIPVNWKIRFLKNLQEAIARQFHES